MSDQPHWSKQGAAPAERAGEPAVLPTLGVVAQRIADVSPAWSSVTVEPGAAPRGVDLTALGRVRAQGLESIREGWLVHRGAARLVTGASPDLGLLVGDWCYAAGLCTIADQGSLDDIADLAALVADVSARCDEDLEQLQPRWDQAEQQLADRRSN